MIYGEITYNYASMDGGGFFISASKENSAVLMLSGSLGCNTAAKNGGGMAVKSDNTTSAKIEVEIGCLMHHLVENGSPKPFSYAGDNKYDAYASFDNKEYKHESCPVVEHNNAGIKGGGFYLDSDSSTISFYCVEESENTAADINGAGMDVEGGRVIIGDEAYHNHPHDIQMCIRDRRWSFEQGEVMDENDTNMGNMTVNEPIGVKMCIRDRASPCCSRDSTFL